MDTVKSRKGELRTKFMVATSLAVVKWGSPALGFGSFGDDFSPVIHGKQEYLVELAFGYFQDFHARFRANGTGSKSIELSHVAFHVAVRKLCPLPPEPSP